MIPITVLDETLSTNSHASRFFTEGSDGPHWFVANKQTAGRGRQNRQWTHIEGNFAGTLIWPLEKNDLRMPAVPSFSAGLAVAEALELVGLPPGQSRLKWPNDVHINRAKVAGILVETAERAGDRSLLVGIGTNLVGAPEGGPYPTTFLGAHISSDAPSLRDFANLVGQRWAHWWKTFQVEGFDPIRAAWLDRAAGLGDHAEVIVAGEIVAQGQFAGVDDVGAAILHTDQGVRRFLSGDVSLRSRNS